MKHEGDRKEFEQSSAKAGAVCSETAFPVSSRDPGSSSLIQSPSQS